MSKSLDKISSAYEVFSRELSEFPERINDPGFMSRYDRVAREFEHAKKRQDRDDSRLEDESHHIFAKIRKLFNPLPLEPVYAEI